ncbi:hypothetical protein MHU86_2616 [Fragilaria crotonensis]|nr:hypothetical protein MHU86_2616 [Fragilaria crotonensis]
MLLYKGYCTDFDAATNFLSGLISNLHSGAQIDYYANQHSNNKRTRFVSGVDSYDGRGRGRARGGSRYGQQYGSGRGGHGRGEQRGRGGGRDDHKIKINNVDVTDPHGNFTTEEWEQLGPARSHVLQLRNASSGRGGRVVGGRGGGRGSSSGGQQNASSTSTTASNNDTPSNHSQQQVSEQSTVVSELTERGSQNGRGFGRRAYT